jgi:hypothetical protein
MLPGIKPLQQQMGKFPKSFEIQSTTNTYDERGTSSKSLDGGNQVERGSFKSRMSAAWTKLGAALSTGQISLCTPDGGALQVTD